MLDVEFSERARERFLDLDSSLQQVIGAVLNQARRRPDAVLQSTTGYAEYTAQVANDPEDYIVLIRWDKQADTLYVMTLGPASQMYE